MGGGGLPTMKPVCNIRWPPPERTIGSNHLLEVRKWDGPTVLRNAPCQLVTRHSEVRLGSGTEVDLYPRKPG